LPSTTFAGRYEFYPGKYTGYSRPERFATTNGYYSTLVSGYTPTLLTSLNYPGVYGSYIFGPGEAPNIATPFQTRLDNAPSDNPVNAPYAPLARSLAEVPEKATIALTTTVEARGRPALIDVFLPRDAALTFQGVPMSETGPTRAFQSPPLLPGRTYTYDVRARWRTDGGQEVVRSRRLIVRAGDHLELDLNREVMPGATESEDQRPTLRTQPLPMMREKRPVSPDW
jgi:uncharacterized protein (TIGR03000 family)